jgi:beta-N-acetylhexosaminidase
MKIFFGILFQLLITISICSQAKPQFLVDFDQKWVDDQIAKMSIDHKIGQLLMPRGNNSGNPIDVAKLATWVKDYKIGGIVFFAGPPTNQVKVTNYLQSLSDIPLFIGEDFEWGLGMRLDSTDRFPYQMALGAMEGNEQLIEKMGNEIGRQCKRIGVHINYAPVVDVNNNINNPVINFRSFGSNKDNVAKKGLAYMKGLQSNKVIATAKHFPGHGDTNVDSHHDLPVIYHDTLRLNNIELMPFQKLINQGLSGVMTAHLVVPSLEQKPGLAATFSKNIVSNLLRKKMQFEGLTFTDAMDMKGAVKNFPNGQALVEAILAGNDILETFEDLPNAVNAIKAAVKEGVIPVALLDERVRKILKAKSWVGLNKYKPIDTNGLIEDLNSATSNLLNKEFAEASVTLIRNDDDVLPVKRLDDKIAIVSIDANQETVFQAMSRNYGNITTFNLPIKSSDKSIDSLYEILKNYNQVIIGLHLKEVRVSSKYSLNESNKKAIHKFSNLSNSTLILFGNVLALSSLDCKNYKSILLAYQDSKYTEDVASQIVFGGLGAKGKLPMTINSELLEGFGLSTKSIRMSYGLPEQVGIDSRILNFKIDSIMLLGLKEKAFPGGVVNIVKNGRSIFNKAYGFYTYEEGVGLNPIETTNYIFDKSKSDAMDYFIKPDPQESKNSVFENRESSLTKRVKHYTLYDLASITKISTSALAAMILASEEKFSINDSFSKHLPILLSSNKSGLTFLDMTTHRSGLKSWIPFWRNSIDTINTIQNAIILDNSLDSFLVKKIIRPSFFRKLFGGKTKVEVDFIQSLKTNPILFTKALNSKSITWKLNSFNKRKSQSYNITIGDSLYMSNENQSKIFKDIEQSSLNKSQGYVYSDLHYYYYPQLVKNITNLNFEDYVGKVFSEIGASTMTFNPLDKFAKSLIAPTEYDSLFRKELIHGSVHDEGAIMMGGISGHAGLFGNANDLSKLMLLYLNKGSYGGKRYFKTEIIDQFTDYQFPNEKNRRGIFFDKKDLDNSNNAPSLFSSKSYGHSGFTGTFTWTDPDLNLIYVVLTNRVYPTRENKKISDLNIRSAIGNAIIECINKGI